MTGPKSGAGTGRLAVDADDLAKCVSCGLCLSHCPTYRVTGEEAFSPRGRIAAMRAVADGAPAGPRFVDILQSCVVCRACETACPSSVPFGRLMEGARATVAPGAVPWWQRLAYRVLERPRLLARLTAAGGLAQRAGLVPGSLTSRMALPRLPVRRRPLHSTGADVWLFTGCVMDAWQRPVHQATIAVLGAVGAGVSLPGPAAACCGALHAHAGLHDRAAALARRVITAFPGGAPILVNSAGCGAALKEYGQLLGTAEASDFSARVLDVHEWLAERAERLPPNRAGASPLRIAVQDPCHLRHAQHAEGAVRAVLGPYGDLVELPDEGGCCGAGGAYSALRPGMARAIRSQKLAVIVSARADVVASPNPGCALWLSAAGVPTRHPMEIVAEAAGLLTSPTGEVSASRSLSAAT